MLHLFRQSILPYSSLFSYKKFFKVVTVIIDTVTLLYKEVFSQPPGSFLPTYATELPYTEGTKIKPLQHGTLKSDCLGLHSCW